MALNRVAAKDYGSTERPASFGLGSRRNYLSPQGGVSPALKRLPHLINAHPPRGFVLVICRVVAHAFFKRKGSLGHFVHGLAEFVRGRFGTCQVPKPSASQPCLPYNVRLAKTFHGLSLAILVCYNEYGPSKVPAFVFCRLLLEVPHHESYVFSGTRGIVAVEEGPHHLDLQVRLNTINA